MNCASFTFLLGLFAVSVEATPADTSEWFPFTPRNDYSPAVIDLGDWIEKPAGARGFVQIEGDRLVFQDGTPVKFWGTNISSRGPFSSKEKVDTWVAQMLKYGINAIRFHKFTWDATDGIDSTRIVDRDWERYDYFVHQLRENGIYHGWSHIYGHRVRPGDREKLVAYEEIAGLKYPWAHLNGTTSSLVNFAPDLQALNIELTVNMLNHVNPHTGLRYANDPSLAFIELQNEDNIFWSAIGRSLQQAPTYRAMLCQMFSDWLRAKYRSQETLERAWGPGALPEGQTLARGNIFPAPDHGTFSSAYDRSAQTGDPVPQHVLDKMEFLYEKQVEFYDRFVNAIRETGYQGVIVGSCWQAGSGFSHYYNLHADYLAGMIDRHNYYGGGSGHQLRPGQVKNRAMVSKPGSGLFSTGMQQVVDRPFSLSEWMSLIPNEWVVEGTPIIAIYGMGLQGWDASFHFAHDEVEFTETLQKGHGVYNVTSPTQLGLYPVLARMVHRNDVAEAEVFSTRYVHIPSLRAGKLGFREEVVQGYDDKFITGDVPSEALAKGRVVVEFADTFRDTGVVKVEALLEPKETAIRSTTGELYWNFQDQGFFTVDTPATQGVVGFGGGREHAFGDLRIELETPFAVALATALGPDESLATARRILLTTMARARNKGMVYSEDSSELLAVGEAPILLEPVRLWLSIDRPTTPTVHILDHDGHRTGQTVDLHKGNQWLLDSGTTNAIYYELEF